jgi:hypothetical protein
VRLQREIARAVRNLRLDLGDEQELAELARCFEYPYPLKDS